MIPISGSLRSERRGRRPSTPAENTAPGPRCARSRSAPIPGSIGSIRSTSDRGDLAIGARRKPLGGWSMLRIIMLFVALAFVIYLFGRPIVLEPIDRGPFALALADKIKK